jgi:hypothetical protein
MRYGPAFVPPRPAARVYAQKQRDPVPDPEDDDLALTDETFRKFHYIDPGVIQYQRASFENLFYSTPAHLTGEELQQLAENNLLELSVENAVVLLLIYNRPWTEATAQDWDRMAELLNDWTAEKVVRETLTAIFANIELFDGEAPLKVPLNVRHEPPS